MDQAFTLWHIAPPVDINIHGWRIMRTIHYTDLVIAIAFGLVVAALIYFIIRYRAKPGHSAVYDKGDRIANIIATVCLAMTVFFGIDMVIEHQSFNDLKEAFWNYPQGDNVLKVEVMPQQYAWNFRYAGADNKFGTDDDVVAPLNQMHVPVNTPVSIQMAPYDVVHAFYVPNLRIKQDATPGLVTSFWFEANREGVYEIACSALCGNGHTNMRGFLTVESKEKFDQWLASQGPEVSADAVDDAWGDDASSGGVLTKWGWDWQAKGDAK